MKLLFSLFSCLSCPISLSRPSVSLLHVMSPESQPVSQSRSQAVSQSVTGDYPSCLYVVPQTIVSKHHVPSVHDSLLSLSLHNTDTLFLSSFPLSVRVYLPYCILPLPHAHYKHANKKTPLTPCPSETSPHTHTLDHIKPVPSARLDLEKERKRERRRKKWRKKLRRRKRAIGYPWSGFPGVIDGDHGTCCFPSSPRSSRDLRLTDRPTARARARASVPSTQ